MQSVTDIRPIGIIRLNYRYELRAGKGSTASVREKSQCVIKIYAKLTCLEHNMQIRARKYTYDLL